MSTAQDLRATLEPVLVALGLVVEDISVTPAGKRRLVRVLVDSDLRDLDVADTTSVVTPLSLDAVAEATRAVSDTLDASDAMGEAPYVLEVSSPGVGRRLSSRDQLRRQVGRLVEVTHGGDGHGSDTGRLVEVGADALTITVAGTKKAPPRTVAIDLAAVEHAVVQVEFRHADPAEPAGPADGAGAEGDAPDVDDAGADAPANEGDH